jgi:hypothetical protein
MTPSELRNLVENSGKEPYFFDRETMKFFGDTMKNYGVRSGFINDTEVWELYRKKPVKHGLFKSAFFNKETFERIIPRSW